MTHVPQSIEVQPGAIRQKLLIMYWGKIKEPLVTIAMGQKKTFDIYSRGGVFAYIANVRL